MATALLRPVFAEYRARGFNARVATDARSAATADITIAPPLGRVRWSDFSHRGQEFIAVGEEATRGKIAEMRDLIPFMSAVAAA